MAKQKGEAPKIVSAVGSGVAAPRHGSLAKRIEEAMAAAVRDALAEGVPMSDVDTIRARQLAARDAVKAGS